MRTLNLPVAVFAVLALTAGGAWADPPRDARAGLEALNRGDNDEAIRLFTQALLYGSSLRPDREFVYVKRAEALLATGRGADATADTMRALALNPRDAEAIEVRDKARPPAAASAAAPFRDPSDALNAKIKTGVDAIAARNRAAFETYLAQVADYEAKKAAIAEQTKANDEAYAASLVAHQAQVDELARKNATDIADWKRRVEACKSGDRSQCAHRSAGEQGPGAPAPPPDSVTP
ncbi:MAG: hypothetical protein M3T55_08685 [Pseudomonadota bacterium]|nr:hypothetical protein [Pseudomonadota bacterium]